jgi:hypothetical protein
MWFECMKDIAKYHKTVTIVNLGRCKIVITTFTRDSSGRSLAW